MSKKRIWQKKGCGFVELKDETEECTSNSVQIRLHKNEKDVTIIVVTCGRHEHEVEIENNTLIRS